MTNRYSRILYGAYATDGGSAALVPFGFGQGLGMEVRATQSGPTGNRAGSGGGTIVGDTYAAGREAGRVEFVSSRYAFLSAVPAESDYVSNGWGDGVYVGSVVQSCGPIH